MLERGGALLIPIMLHLEAEKKNGIIIGLIYFFIYVLTSQASRLSSRFVVHNKMNISFITLLFGFTFGVVSGALYSYGFWIIALIAFVGIFIVENIRKPILTGFIADQVPNEILTSLISAQSFIRTLMTALLALVFGIIADSKGIGISFLVVSLSLVFIIIVLHSYARFYNKRRLT